MECCLTCWTPMESHGVCTPVTARSQAQVCPYCKGQGTVSKPPWVAGDKDWWVSSGTQTYICPTCSGQGFVVVQI